MKCFKCNETNPLFKIGEYNDEITIYLCRYHVKMEQTNLDNTIVDWSEANAVPDTV